MAKSGASRNGGTNKNANLANHSSVHSESESNILGALSSINPPRRQSLRLKGINAVYGSVDAHNSKLYQPNTNNHSFVTGQIKVEVLHEEGDINDNCKRRCSTYSSDLDSSSNTDDTSIISMTLKDFQARCKAKKRKSFKYNASTSTVLTSQSSSDLSEEQDHSSERPDEEPDLNLPLISLKLKVTKKSSPPGRKRSRLCSSEHTGRVGKINACTSSKIDICSKAEPSEGGEEDFQALAMKNFIEINDSIPPPVGQLKIDPEPLNVKNEILENGSWDDYVALDAGKISSLGTSNKCQEVYETELSEESIFSANRFQELHANNFTGINGFNSPPNSLVQIELNDHAANPELTCSIKSEILDAHNQEHESTLFVANPASGDFSCPVDMPVEVDGDVESDLQMEEINCSDNKISQCCVNEASMVHMKHKHDCLADFAEDAICTESSEPVAASRLLPDTSTSTNINGFPLEDSIHGKNVNQLNDGSVNFYENEEVANYVSLKAMEDHGNMVCEEQAEELSVCSICTDGVIDNSDGFRESQVSFAHSAPSNKVEYLGNMVDEVLSTDLLTKHNKVHISCDSRDYSRVGKHGLFSQKVDQFNDQNDSDFAENGGSTNDMYDCSPIKVIEDCGIVVDKGQARELPICIINSNPAINNRASFWEFHDSGDTSPTDDSAESLDNIVDDVHRKEVPEYCDKTHLLFHAGGHFVNGTHNLRSQQLNVCSSNGSISQITCDRLHETELVSAPSENTLNYCGSRINCDSNEFTRVIDTKVVRVAVDDHSPQCPTPCLASFCLLRLTDDSTSEAKENILPTTFHNETDAAAVRPTCLPEILPKDDSPKTEFTLDQSIGGLENTPEKLLSNRKTISPTSQEKLCQAVNGADLYDALHSSKTRKRLWYENSAANEIPSILSGLKETKPLSCSDRMTNKPKSRNDSLPLAAVKGILKSPNASNRSPCSCMESSLAKKQTQKAIEFSQQQMHDIEGVAMKLLKGLKSMKSIVQRNMLSEDSLPMTSNLTSDEIRAALDNASTLEGYTKRWLTIMARDCNRFCKIMKGDKKEASPVNGIHKEGKKISFADEAGGLLCHVKMKESTMPFCR